MTLVGVSVIILYDLFYAYLEEHEVYGYFLYLPIYIRSFIPIGLYFFVRFLIEPKNPMNQWERLWYIPIILEIVLELAYIPADFLLSENDMLLANNILLVTEESIGLLICVVLLGLTIRKLNRYQKFLMNNYSSLSGKSLLWLRNLIIATLIIVIFWLLSHFQFLMGYDNEGTYSIVSLGMVLFLFWMGYFVILQFPLFQTVPYSEMESRTETPKQLSPKTVEYHKKLVRFMEEEYLYTDPELNLPYLAKKLQISSGYLSQIINERENKSFFQFVNQYRVEAAKAKLISTAYDQYSIMGIALESGFNSKSTFNSLFKKFTGQTPTAYKKSFQTFT